jgi:hypothetical protein
MMNNVCGASLASLASLVSLALLLCFFVSLFLFFSLYVPLLCVCVCAYVCTSAVGCGATATGMIGTIVTTKDYIGSTDNDKDASCCALCQADKRCEFWMRSTVNSSCYVMSNFSAYTSTVPSTRADH